MLTLLNNFILPYPLPVLVCKLRIVSFSMIVENSCLSYDILPLEIRMKCLYLLITVFIISQILISIFFAASAKKRDMILSAKKIRAVITAHDFP